MGAPPVLERGVVQGRLGGHDVLEVDRREGGLAPQPAPGVGQGRVDPDEQVEAGVGRALVGTDAVLGEHQGEGVATGLLGEVDDAHALLRRAAEVEGPPELRTAGSGEPLCYRSHGGRRDVADLRGRDGRRDAQCVPAHIGVGGACGVVLGQQLGCSLGHRGAIGPSVEHRDTLHVVGDRRVETVQEPPPALHLGQVGRLSARVLLQELDEK